MDALKTGLNSFRDPCIHFHEPLSSLLGGPISSSHSHLTSLHIYKHSPLPTPPNPSSDTSRRPRELPQQVFVVVVVVFV
ncbi:hypothetical protein AKJ16_DCAP24687 [Drosera capensis]